MPAFLVPIISAIGTAVGGTFGAFLIMNAAYVASAVVLIGGLALSAAQSARAKKAQKEAYNAAQVDRLANVVTSVAMRELVLGRVRKGGPVVFRGSAGALKDRFLVHIALAAHEIDAVEAVYLNGEEVELDEDGYVQTAPYMQQVLTSASHEAVIPPTGGVITLPHTPVTGTVSAYVGGAPSTGGNDADTPTQVAVSVDGADVTIILGEEGQDVTIEYQYMADVSYAKIHWDLGDGTAVADSATENLFPTLWTENHRGQGIAKLIAVFWYNETAFPSGVPGLTARIRGAKVYDPRTETTAWSENPALLARHVYQHEFFGKAAVSEAEDERFITAANACDVEHDYVMDGETETRAMFTAGTVAPYGATAASLLDDLTQAMGGMWAFAGGELYIRAGVYTAPVMTLTDADLAVVQRTGENEGQEQVSIAVHRERAEKFNTVNLRIWDEGQEYKQVGLTPLKSDALVTRDGGELAQEVSLVAVSHAGQAQHIAGIMMRDARDPLSLEAPFKMRAYPLELFDTVQVTLARYGWTAKTFMILGREWHHERGFIKLIMKETSAAIYTPDAEFRAQGYARNTALPNPWDIDPPVLVAADVHSGTDELQVMSDGTILTRVRVEWEPLTDSTITSSGTIEIQWKRAGTAQWQSVFVDGSASEAYLLGAKDRSNIIIRARSRNSVAVSAWCEQVAHRVVGKTEAPDAPTRFKVVDQPRGVKQFFWTLNDPPPDLSAFTVRYALGSGEPAWSDMIPLFSADADERQRETNEPRMADTYTFAIRSKDTTGNLSTPLYVTATLDGTTAGDAALIVLPYELGWPGVKTDCYVSGTDLVPTTPTTWGDLAAVSWTDAGSWAEAEGSGTVGTIQYRHTVIDTGSAIARTLVANAVADGTVTIEYASSNDDVTYTSFAAIPSTPITARYFKVRWTVNGDVPILHRAQVIFYV